MKRSNQLIYLFLFFNLIAFVPADQIIQYLLLDFSTALFILLAVNQKRIKKANGK